MKIFLGYEEMTQEADTSMIPIVTMWRAVLERAVDDLKKPHQAAKQANSYDAATWFYSDSMEFNSFQGICDGMGWSHTLIIKNLQNEGLLIRGNNAKNVR